MQSNRVPSLEHSGWHFCSKELELCSQSACLSVCSAASRVLTLCKLLDLSELYLSNWSMGKIPPTPQNCCRWNTQACTRYPAAPLLWPRLPSEPHSPPMCSVLQAFAGCVISHQSKITEWNQLWEPGFLSLLLTTLKSFTSLLLKMKTCINKLAVSFSPGHCCTPSCCSSIPRGSQDRANPWGAEGGDGGVCVWLSGTFHRTAGWAPSAHLGGWTVGCIGPGPWQVKPKCISTLLASISSALQGQRGLTKEAWGPGGQEGSGLCRELNRLAGHSGFS